MRGPLRLLALPAVLAPVVAGCMTVHADGRTQRAEPAGAARPLPVPRPSIPSSSPLLRGSDPVKPSAQEEQQDGRQEDEDQPSVQTAPPAPAPAVDPSAVRRAVPHVPQHRQDPAPRVLRPRTLQPSASVAPVDLCHWGQRAGAVDGRLAELCRRTYG